MPNASPPTPRGAIDFAPLEPAAYPPTNCAVTVRRAGKLARLDVDQRSGEIALLIRREGLGRRHRLQQPGGKQVERNDALLGLRTRNARAVERRRRVSLAESADEDVLVVLHRHAAHALHGLGGVAVRALGDLFGGHGVDDAHRGALLVERFVDGAAFDGRGHDLRGDARGGGRERNVLLERLSGGELKTVTVFGVKPRRRTVIVTVPAGTDETEKRPSTPDCTPSVVPTI